MKTLIKSILRQETVLIEGKKLSTDDFIRRAEEIHGDKYNYDKTNYVNSNTKVTITCPKHGDFLQNPMVHIHDKSGCPTCNGRPKINTDIFIKRAQEKHGDKYDYSKVNYVNQKTPLIIKCPRHGVFTQRPDDHLKGTGCPKCGIELNASNKKSNTDEFIEKSRKVHGDKYDYNQTKYIGARNKIIITCPIHGNFTQSPNSHLNGGGCPDCAIQQIKDKQRFTTDEFISMAKDIHDEYYDYSNVNYVNTQTKVQIVCPVHGVFSMSPRHHINRKQGCPECGKVKIGDTFRSNTLDFIKKSREEHGDKYDYTYVDYKKNSIPVKIICPIHGEFEQTPNTHLGGSGCPECGKESVLQARTYDNDDFIRKSKEIHGEKYDYSLVNYTVSTDIVDIICPKHGVFSQQAGSHMRGAGCLSCQESKGEMYVSNILKNLNIKFIRQHKFTDCRGDKGKKYCRRLPFDFYLPDYHTMVEYDGKQHFEPVSRFGGVEGFNKLKRNDEIKNLYCEKNNIKMIRIPYTMNKDDIPEYIKEQLNIK
jgi:ferredoxin-like protein FixX